MSECFCDGDGAIECLTCGGLEIVTACMDDLCRGTDTCQHMRTCPDCKGTGVMVCGAVVHTIVIPEPDEVSA